MMSDITTLDNRTDNLFNRISELIEQSRRFAVNAVNVAEVRTRFEVGRYIFEDEQRGERATYGQQVLKKLSTRLMEHYAMQRWATNDPFTRARVEEACLLCQAAEWCLEKDPFSRARAEEVCLVCQAAEWRP